MNLRPGSWPWLLHNEMRLSWRGVKGSHLGVITFLGGLLWLFMHWGAWVSLPSMTGFVTGMRQVPVFGGGLFWLFAALAVSQTTAHAVNAFIVRGDLDLLLSSPLSQRDIFLVRGLAIALSAVLLPAFALLPLANVGPFCGFPGFLAIYPALAAAALGCAAAGILLTMTLVRLLGARRARTAGQVFAAVIGAAFFLAFQIPNMLPDASKKALAGWLKASLMDNGPLGPASLLWWPFRALYGEPLPLAALVLAGTLGFWLVINLTYRRFVTGTQEALTGGRAPAAAGKDAAFSAGLTRILLFKEWKLILRDMQLISQALLQLLYLLPMVFAGFRHGPQNPFIVPAIVAAAAMLAGNLAWITVNAEDAPELVATAPVPVRRVLWIKAAAAVLPVLAILLPLAAWWIPRGPAESATLLGCGVGGMLSAALVQVWSPKPGKRTDIKNRHKAGGPAGFIELFSTVSWIAMAVFLDGRQAWLPVAAGGVLIALLSAWYGGSEAREEHWGRSLSNA